jgi:CRISPR/Cas system-associated exonuclease Cas4 (RecB family)
MPGKRPKDGKPSVYATNLAGLLSGDKECKFATWFKSRYWYDKIEDTTFDRAGWTGDHTAMVQAEQQRLVADGWTVTVESANKFDLEGKVGSIAGKPDIRAEKWADGKPVAVRLVDCKTGRQRNSDFQQVLLYLYAELKMRPANRGVIHGYVVYKEQRVYVPLEELTEARVLALGMTMREVCGQEPPKAAPSQRECQYCDIPAAYCVARWQAAEPKTAVDDF